VNRREASIPRSLLYVPGHRADLLAKAARSGADAVVADLEDSVPPADKDAAREVVGDWLAQPAPTPQRWVRIAGEVLDADLAATDASGTDGVLLATARVSGLARLDAWFASSAADCPVVGLVEDAAGVTEIAAMAAHDRLLTVGVGEVDLLADLRVAPAATATVAALRLQVVLAAAAAGLAAPIAPTSTDFRDLEAFAESTRALVAAGFRSRTAIHPAQVPVVNEVLTPGEDELADARDVLERFERAGRGVTTDARGRLIDLAVVRAARETVARAGH
jgi:citrate lyase subunit beta / citryl-CoA lyase